MAHDDVQSETLVNSGRGAICFILGVAGCYRRGRVPRRRVLVALGALTAATAVCNARRLLRSVSNVSDGGSDLPDAEVISCVLKSFYELRFPKPERGIVTVVYPVMLEPG